MLFDQIYSEVLQLEGGSAYTDDKTDRGGKTRYGITEATARAHGYKGEMKDLPKDVARSIYRDQYWDINRLDDVGALSEKIAKEVYDTGVNMGTGVAARFLQQSINYLNYDHALGADLVVDGQIGRLTTNALAQLLRQRGPQGEVVVLRCLNGLQQARYMEIAAKDISQRKYAYGWTLNRVVM